MAAGTNLTRWLAVLLLAQTALRAEDVPLPPPTPPALSPNLSDDDVMAAIDRGVDFLLKDLDQKTVLLRKAPLKERWTPNAIGDAGELMLEMYALLHVGGDTQDRRLHFRAERLQLPIDVMLRAQIDSTYTTALQALALAELPQSPEVKKAMARAALRLVEGTGEAGGYTYQIDTPGSPAHDQSNSQYGVLGVWAAADWGVMIPNRYWKSTDDFWRAMQTKSGGWGYGGNGPAEPPKNSMTAAGVASLYICNEFLDRVPSLTPKEDPALDSGLASLIQNFDPKSSDFYYLYGVERVGLASGLKYLGQTNWFRAAAASILKTQQADGSFSANFIGANPVRATCYALLFLIRGRAPVVMNKLSYDGPWNARPRDSANLHARLGHMLERHLNWQIVPLSVPVEEWLDAPILLITGSTDPHFTPDDLDKFRKFVDDGGIIFSTADGNSQIFSDAMQRYAAQLAGPQHPYRQLPPDHPLFSVYGKPKATPPLFGVSNGVREMWIHSPLDYGAIWQSRTETFPDAWELPARLFFYAAGKAGLRSKLQSLAVPDPPGAPSNSVSVAQLQYAGNWNAEPGAWPRLAKLLALNADTAMDLQSVKITDLATLSTRPALAHLCGTGKLVLSDDERAALSIYVQTGGTLFVEALGGDPDFSASARDLLATLFPQGKLKTVPPDYILYNGGISPHAVKIASVEYRKFWILAHAPLATPRLQFITIDGRIGAFFSEDDLSSGLLGTNTWGISGYMPSSSVALARNIVLFAQANTPQKK